MSEILTWHTVADDELVYADEVCAFLQKNFQNPDSDPIWFKDYFKWKLSSQNPAGKGYLSIGFEGNTVIACISLVKRKIYFGRQVVIGAEFGDAYCSPDFFANVNKYSPHDNDYQGKPPSHYLNRSIFGRIADEITIRATNDGVVYLYGLPNENAYSSWIKRLNHFNFYGHNIYSLSRSLGLRRINNSRFATILKGLGQTADGLGWDYKIFRNNLWRGQQLRIEDEFPDENTIARIWEDHKSNVDFGLVRDYSYWKHRYVDHPLKKYQVFSVMQEKETVGLFVTTLQRISSDNTVLFFVEWMIKTDIQYKGILLAIIQKYRNKKFDTMNVNVSSDDPLYGLLKSYSFETNFKVNITFRQTLTVTPETFLPKSFMLFLGNTDAV